MAKKISGFFSDKKRNPQKEKRYADILFQHLAPMDSVDDSATFGALDYALSQQNIHNIAVTGNYGFGKSSILTSYAKKRLKGKCLNISLATFAIEEANDNKNSSQQDTKKPDEVLPENTAQKIEKSILQQIFYRNYGGKFPYSRFNRIKKISFWKKCCIEARFCCCSCSRQNFLKPTHGQKLLQSNKLKRIAEEKTGFFGKMQFFRF